MLMGLADLALYAAIVGGTGNRDAVTASLSINFLRKTPPGGVLAHANILKTGRMAAGEVLLVPEAGGSPVARSEEHTSELQSLMRTSYAVFCLKKKNKHHHMKTQPRII